MPLLFESERMDSMPKKIDPQLRARCVRLVREHLQEYPTRIATEESAEVKRLKAENKRLREDNEILRRASIFFAGELDPCNR